MAKEEIFPGKGIGNAIFGMEEESIVKSFGEPDFMESYSEESFGSTHVLYYFEKGLTLYFDEEDAYRLGCIEVDSYDFYLFGKNIARLSKKDFKKFLSENKIFDLVEEDDEHQEALFSDSLSIAFYFEYDSLISLQLGVFTDEKERPIWPESS